MQPTPATWVALPESRAGGDWAAFPAPPSPAQESKASRRFRTVFEDPAQPLFSRIAALNPALFSLPAAGEAEERRDLVADADGFEAGAKEILRDTVQAAASAEANPLHQLRRDLGALGQRLFAEVQQPSAASGRDQRGGRLGGRSLVPLPALKQAGNTALITSTCTDGRQRWTANIRLAVDGDRLVWSSERGSQTYVRCDSGTSRLAPACSVAAERALVILGPRSGARVSGRSESASRV